MDDIPDFDLSSLDDSFFDVHEVVFNDENELFKLATCVDTVVKRNPKGQSDGVFRGRLADTKPDLKVTLLETFDTNALGKHLVAQFLIAPNDSKCFVMEHNNIKLKPKESFSKAVSRLETFQPPKPNCCTRVLNQGGPKHAVKHFYEALQSKAIAVPKWHEPASDCSVSSKKARYDSRQSILKSQDPFTKCALIEKSIKSKAYEVKSSSEETGDEIFCQCHMCHMHEQSEKIICEPFNIREDGEGDNCSLYYSGIEESSERNLLYITPNFALAHLCHLNMLTDLDSYYPGISYPFLYVGGLHSFFPIHIEDMSLWSINYHHAGHPKLWIIVAPSDVSKLSQLLTLYGLHNLHRVCIFKLSHKSTVVFPQFLLHHKINFRILIQKPGDFIFLAPNAAHTGGNMGENLCQACNIGTTDWLPYGSVASLQDCRCMEHRVHMDVTSLIKIHRKDLLDHHLNKSMHKMYKDGHFEKSIVMMSSDARQQDSVLVPSTVQRSTSASSSAKPSSSRKSVKSNLKAPISCPVKNCFTEYKVPNKKRMMNHIRREHPGKAEKRSVLNAVDALFAKYSLDSSTSKSSKM